MTGNPLDPLLKPRSVALIGASPRAGSVGNDMLKVLRGGGFNGAIWPINPKYDEIDGLACHGSVAALPVTVARRSSGNPAATSARRLAWAHAARVRVLNLPLAG